MPRLGRAPAPQRCSDAQTLRLSGRHRNVRSQPRYTPGSSAPSHWHPELCRKQLRPRHGSVRSTFFGSRRRRRTRGAPPVAVAHTQRRTRHAQNASVSRVCPSGPLLLGSGVHCGAQARPAARVTRPAAPPQAPPPPRGWRSGHAADGPPKPRARTHAPRDRDAPWGPRPCGRPVPRALTGGRSGVRYWCAPHPLKCEMVGEGPTLRGKVKPLAVAERPGHDREQLIAGLAHRVPRLRGGSHWVGRGGRRRGLGGRVRPGVRVSLRRRGAVVHGAGGRGFGRNGWRVILPNTGACGVHAPVLRSVQGRVPDVCKPKIFRIDNLTIMERFYTFFTPTHVPLLRTNFMAMVAEAFMAGPNPWGWSWSREPNPSNGAQGGGGVECSAEVGGHF